MTVAGSSAGLTALRAKVQERIDRKLDKYLPLSGDLREWTISEIEDSLLADLFEVARDVIEARLHVDPGRVVGKPKCPDCGKALGGVARERSTHKQTRAGPVRYARTYGVCHACGVAFPPSGRRMALRQGLL